MTEDEEDKSDVGEIFFQRRDVPQPPVPADGVFHLPHNHVSAPPHIKPEDHDETSDWTVYQI